MIVDSIFWVLNKIILIVGKALQLLINMLPTSPFQFLKNSEFDDFVAQINFFIPIYEFISILQMWLVAVALYYLYSVFARWVKAIE